MVRAGFMAADDGKNEQAVQFFVELNGFNPQEVASEVDRLVRPRHADVHEDRHSSGDNLDRGFRKNLPLLTFSS